MANLAGVLKGLEQERSRLQKAIEVIGQLVGRNSTGTSQPRAQRPKRTMSAAARRRISLAQKARWAKARRVEGSTPVRTMSQSARKKIAAAQRARWAKTRAEQKKAA